MAISKGRKICVALALLLIVLVFVLPFVLGLFLRETVEKKIGEAVNAPVKLGGLSVSLLMPGATLSNLEIGEATAATDNRPLVAFESLRVNVSFGTVFGGDLHVTGFKSKGAQVHLACDEKGEATLAAFLDKMPPSTRTAALPIDSFSMRDSLIFLHVPKAVLAPKSSLEFEPVQIEVTGLNVGDLVLPAPGQAVPKEQWARIEVSEVAIRSPVKGQPAVDAIAEAGEPIAEGVTLTSIAGQIMFPDALTKPLKIQGVVIDGLNIRNVLNKPGDPDTLDRIMGARGACLKSPPAKPGEKGMSLGNGGVYLADLNMGKSAIELQGSDANGKPAYWRMTDLKAEIEKIGAGPGTDGLGGGPGHLKIASPTRSSEGDGEFSLAWTEVTGSWPQLTFKQAFSVTKFALPVVSSRVEHSTGAGIEKGTLDAEFSGTTTQGKVEWDGSITLSADTKMVGKGYTGKLVSSLSAVATGTPIKTVRIRGTLEDPQFNPPDFAAGALLSIGKGIVSGNPFNAFKAFGTAMGSAVDQGVREGEKLIKKIPGVGGLFGGDEKSK
ncbi:MAG: hypothetical protein KIS92_17740 [Planctomycetota bacterium]|nr:hypothetical protein [Planctomycetota bacterium]